MKRRGRVHRTGSEDVRLYAQSARFSSYSVDTAGFPFETIVCLVAHAVRLHVFAMIQNLLMVILFAHKVKLFPHFGRQ